MRALVITMLDVRGEANQRVHHVARMLAEVADEVVVLAKQRPTARTPGGILRDALRVSIEEHRDGNVRTLLLHPPLNYAHALTAGIRNDGRQRPGTWRRVLGATLSLLGTARDLVLVPAFVAAALRCTRGTFDLCLAQGPWEAAIGWSLRRLGRVRRLAYEDIDYVAGGQRLGLRRAYVGWLERTLIGRSDVTISSGFRLGALRRQTTGRDVVVIPNGVDPRRFASARVKRPHPPTLVYVGHLAEYTGMDVVIRAMPRVRDAVCGARLLVAGGGDRPYVHALIRLAAELDLADAVEFRGPVPYDAVPALLAESDVGVATFRPIPYGDYAFPLKVVEYMTAGLPVIGTAGSETALLLERTQAGLAIAFDADAIAGAAIALLRDEARYARCSTGAMAAAAELTWERAMALERATLVEAMA